ncbi:MAG TPA: phosphatidate cytidylyltransferase [Puia sp.]|jgi:hypothetical protein
MSKSFTRLFWAFLLVALVAVLPGCAVVGGIFKAGVWVGVLAVVLVIGLILWIVSKSSK